MQETLGLNSSFGILFKLHFIYPFWMGMLGSDAGVSSCPSARYGGKRVDFLLFISLQIKWYKSFSLFAGWTLENCNFSGEKPVLFWSPYLEGTRHSSQPAQCSSAHARMGVQPQYCYSKHFQVSKQSWKAAACSNSQGSVRPAAAWVPLGHLRAAPGTCWKPPHRLGFILFFFFLQELTTTRTNKFWWLQHHVQLCGLPQCDTEDILSEQSIIINVSMLKTITPSQLS